MIFAMIFASYCRVCWFLGKNLSNFIYPVWKLHNPYCHKRIYLIVSKKCFLNGNHICMANIVCKKWFCIQVAKKNQVAPDKLTVLLYKLPCFRGWFSHIWCFNSVKRFFEQVLFWQWHILFIIAINNTFFV